MWVRVKSARSERKAQSMEYALLRDYDDAWNKRRNGGREGMRDILPSEDEDEEDKDDEDDEDDDDDEEEEEEDDDDDD